jgi:hypothetical protein
VVSVSATCWGTYTTFRRPPEAAARLDRADEENVRVPAPGARRESVVDAERRDHDLVRIEAVEVDEIRLRPLRDREDARGTARCARHDGPENDPVAPLHHRRVALEGQVLNRQHRRARAARRDGVKKVRERGPQPPEGAGQRPGHPQLLAPRGQDDGVDPVRNELRKPGDRGDANAVAVRGERAEEPGDVGLVARAVPSQRVRVDDDERSHASSR